MRPTVKSSGTRSRLGQLAVKIDKVPGWYKVELLELVAAVDDMQRKFEVVGGAVEIGVYCGKSFVGLASCCRPSRMEFALAVDVFNQQELNTSKSGGGHPVNQADAFDKTVLRFGLAGITRTITGDSLKLNAGHLISAVGSHPRMFRVDGGHSFDETVHDLELAAGSVCDGGVVFVDDVFNPSWPSISAGVGQVILNGTLAPLMVWLGETVLCKPDDYQRIRSVLFKKLPKHACKDYCGHEVAILLDRPQE